MSVTPKRDVTADGIVPLALEALSLHREARADAASPVVRPSAPVLYFGDLRTYRQSQLRVITVGVNPSGEEFPTQAPWSRFGCARRRSTAIE